MKKTIDQAIAELDITLLASKINCGVIDPRDYQWLAYAVTGEAIRNYKGPAYVTASVGAGKTIMIAMIAKRFQEIGWDGMVLARQGELIEQNADEAWLMECKNSIFSASLNMKSIAYPVVMGTEGTISNALFKELGDFIPRFILIDECHQVNWKDIVESQDDNETYEEMIENKRAQYTQIIRVLQAKCREKYKTALRIFGYSGSPCRGVESINGEFWTGGELVNIDTDYLVKRGFLVPTIFGTPSPDNVYHLEDFHGSGQDGAQDFTLEQLKKMQEEIMEQGTTTQKIMLEVMELTKNRNGVLITCAGKKHCEEAAKYLPPNSYAIVTDSTGQKSRKKALKDAYTGKIKYVLQIGCLTTGVNIPLWDTSVILRKIMSLTLLIQLLGRGMRLLKDEQTKEGYDKDDHLVLDYAGTMFELGELYHNLILEQAEFKRAKDAGEIRECPHGHENSPNARRCIGEDSSSQDGRCDHFFSFRQCGFNKDGTPTPQGGCGTKNDPCARFCRSCDGMLIDPNENLNNKHYTENDYINVDSFNIRPTKNGEGLLFEYGIYKEGKSTLVREVFYPSSESMGARNAWKMKAVIPHVQDAKMRGSLLRMKDIKALLGQKSLFSAPKRITHRVNDKGRDIIHRKDFVGDVN